MPARVADRLSVARHNQFVGRDVELALFQSALTQPELPYFVLYVFGPGGVGKTALLGEMASICEQNDIPVGFVDARQVEPRPGAFLGALGSAMNLAPPSSLVQALGSSAQRNVILVDSYDMLAPLDNWLRSTFLPQLPENVLVVLAGSSPPALAWRTDPGWQSLIRIVPLRNLAPHESRAYLAKRGIPPQQYQVVLEFTHGHPLALSLVADVFSQRPDVTLQPEQAPDVIRTLLERLVQKVPGPAHRTALEACAVVRVTTESLLAELLAMPDVHDLFEWLRGLSFIETSRQGLFPHDLIRNALNADLRWRNPDWYSELHSRARAYYAGRLQTSMGQAQQRVVFDYIFLHRDNPVVRPFFEWQTNSDICGDSMQDSDVAALLAMVTKHEGEDAARLAAGWLARQPGGVRVFRGPEGQAVGFMAVIALHEAAPEDVSADPATQSAWNYLQQRAPLRPGERATLVRNWMAEQTYQSVSPIQSLIFVTAVQLYLSTPGLAFTFFPCAQPEFWDAVLSYAGMARLPEADFEVGGRPFGVFGHDWRAVPPGAWLALLSEREVASAPLDAVSPYTGEPLVVLSRPDFEIALRRALQDFSRLDALRANPLVRSRMVIERCSCVNEIDLDLQVAALKSLVEEAIQQLQASPRDMRCYRALYHTYLQPVPTQEQAAELLGVPFSTFRRHLTAGIGRVAETLWQRELGISEKLSNK